ncbi:MAG: hypothetical protein FWC95_01715 [Defluviitaleaceae bacterium]|nr:hypothetical protein [Defluviitaleaceae bacterium]
MDKLYNLKEAAKKVNCSRKDLRDYHRSGLVAGEYSGGELCFSESVLNDFISRFAQIEKMKADAKAGARRMGMM